MKDYYECPTQVIFIETDNLMAAGINDVDWCTGIAIQDFVICDCCGGVISLEDICYMYEFNDWYDKADYNIRAELGEDIVNQIMNELSDIYNWLEEDRP